MTTTTPGWPHKLEDYPPKYVAYMKERHLYDDIELLRHFEDMGVEPDSCPHDMFNMSPGTFLTLERGVEAEQRGLIYLGKAWEEIALNEQGEVYFEYDTGGQEEVAERINYCRVMFKGEYDIKGWNALDQSNPSLTHYFLSIYNKADAAAYKLKYGGSV